jgi:hypothetical protein
LSFSRRFGACLRQTKKRAEDLERALVSNINVAMDFQTVQEMKLLDKALYLGYKAQLSKVPLIIPLVKAICVLLKTAIEVSPDWSSNR